MFLKTLATFEIQSIHKCHIDEYMKNLTNPKYYFITQNKKFSGIPQFNTLSNYDINGNAL